MNFFFDRCVPIRLARMIGIFEADHPVVHLDDDERFGVRTPDTQWMTVLDADAAAWSVITADTGILRNKVERRVLAGTKLKFFYLTRQWDRMTFHERAWRLVKIWPAIVDAALNVRGRIFEVSGGRSYKVFRVE